MPKFRTVNDRPAVIENRAGGEAYEQSPKLSLVSLLLTSFVSDKFYESEGDQLDRLGSLIDAISDKRFVAKAGIYARNEFGMRSISHALAGELVAKVKGEAWTKNAIERIVRRPDDMLEILGYVASKYGLHPIPNSLKKGLALALNKFDEYQLAKYRGSNSSIKLVDLVNLVHPNVKPELKPVIEKLVKDELRSKDTWERQISDTGQAVAEIQDEDEKAKKLAELKSEEWTELIKSGKIGYFALLRNLRNILQDAPDIVDQACELLIDEKRIRKSLVLPFRYVTALDEIQKLSEPGTRTVIRALNIALDISVANVPKLPGKTLIALDESGSMEGKPIEIGSLFAAILYKSNDAVLMSFSDDARFRALNPDDSTLTLAKILRDDSIMSGTDFRPIFNRSTQKYERIIILSDMQAWVGYNVPTSAYADYKLRTNANPHIYSFDLNGYGDMQFPEKQVYCIAGFSEKVYDLMAKLEMDKQDLVNTIEVIEI
jgi:hypothetical protein